MQLTNKKKRFAARLLLFDFNHFSVCWDQFLIELVNKFLTYQVTYQVKRFWFPIGEMRANKILNSFNVDVCFFRSQHDAGGHLIVVMRLNCKSECCVFWPANRCSECCSLVNFFGNLTSATKRKKRDKAKKKEKNTQKDEKGSHRV